MILFVYGTLLDARVLTRVSGDPGLARQARVAWLDGWRRVVLRGTPYPTLVPEHGARVEGAVLRVNDAAFARLCAYEGSAYALVPVRVVTARGALHARAWIAPFWRADRARDWP